MPLHLECGQESHLQWQCLPPLHQRVSLVTLTLVTEQLCVQFLGLRAGAHFAWQLSCQGLLLIIGVLGSDSGFLWRQTSLESPMPIAPSLSSLILPTSAMGTSGAAQLPSWFPHM